jgi:hypothetical protein
VVKVTVLLLPEMSQDRLRFLYETISVVLVSFSAVTGVETKEGKFVFYPPDKWNQSLGDEIYVKIEGLPVLSPVREEDRRNLGKEMRRVFKELFPIAKYVCCEVYPPDPRIITCDKD